MILHHYIINFLLFFIVAHLMKSTIFKQGMLKFSDKLLSAWVRSTANTLSSLFVLFIKSMLKLFLSNLYTRSDGIRLFAN